MKIGLLTSNEPRHIYFMSKLSDLFNVETKIIKPKKKSFSKIRSLVLKKQKKKEIKFFKKLINREKKKIKIINTNKINSKIVLNKLKKKKLDLLLVFGTSILRKEIFSIPKLYTLNLHTGILPNYRGVDSVIWAFKNNDFKNIGFTIHQVNKGIDSGPYISRKKIAFKKKENIHLVFFKVVVAGVKGMIDIIKKKKFKIMKKYKPNQKGRLYLSKHLEELEKDSFFLKKYII